MKGFIASFFCLISLSANTSLAAAVTSMGGALIEKTGDSFVDTKFNTWTVTANVAYINGKKAGTNFNVKVLLFFNGMVYQQNTSNQWYLYNATSGQWGGTNINGVAYEDPRVPSATGATAFSTKFIVDDLHHVWTLTSKGVVNEDAQPAGTTLGAGGLLYFNGNIFYNTSKGWNEWNGSTWFTVSRDPRQIPKKSISSYVDCNSTADQHDKVKQAISDAKNNAFTLVVDCAVTVSSGLGIQGVNDPIHGGLDIARPIFIDNATTIIFTGTPKTRFIVNNVMIPAFVIANTNNVSLINWNIQYNAINPLSPDPGGFVLNGVWVEHEGSYDSSGVWHQASTQPASAFNNQTLTTWLENSEHKITFPNGNTSYWTGGEDPSAVFFITGDSSNIYIDGFQNVLASNADTYVPYVFAFKKDYKNNQKAARSTPITDQYLDMPHNLVFINATFDGTLMGFQGSLRDSRIENLVSKHYSDLQDATGGNVGGTGHWFAPPHLFYLNFEYAGDRSLFNRNLVIHNIQDLGPRIGIARDGGGYTDSLKVGGDNIEVNQYISKRSDGFADLLVYNGYYLSNVTATYDSSKTGGAYDCALRPTLEMPLTNMMFYNISFTDTAASTFNHGPMGNLTEPGNANIGFKDVTFHVNELTGSSGKVLMDSCPGVTGLVKGDSFNFVTSKDGSWTCD